MPRHSEATLAAIKQAVDIVTLIGEYLPILRAGSKYKVLCPFHDDHHPSMELNPDRQSYKCWVCGAGGDVFDFVKNYERVEFPEALRMLAERAGVSLDDPSSAVEATGGVSKSELRAVNAWAESAFAEQLSKSEAARAYAVGRGLSASSLARFQLGYAPGERGWLAARAKKQGFPIDLLEKAGLVSRPADAPGVVRERFRGRLMFPIHDPQGRTVGFGGRVLPEVEKIFAAAGKRVAKYLNSPETPLFQKRRLVYAGDLARPAAREAGWVAVVEGYTDVIAAHQVGLRNVVGTLGTALGDDHVTALRRLADKVVLVFDGDDAGQNAADKSLELFLGHDVDLRVLTLPDGVDPCDFLLEKGGDAFRSLVETAVDPLAFAIDRASERFDLESIEGSRQAAEWVLPVLAKVPSANRVGLDVKVGKALDVLSRRLRVPVSTLDRRLRQLLVEKGKPRASRFSTLSTAHRNVSTVVDQSRNLAVGALSAPPIAALAAVNPRELDPLGRDLIEVVLNHPGAVATLITRVAVASLRDAPLRAILQACYDLHGEGQPTTFERVVLRLDDPQVRALAARLLGTIDGAPLPQRVVPPSWDDRLAILLDRLTKRDLEERIQAVREALAAVDKFIEPDAYRALHVELVRVMAQRPVSKKTDAS